MKFELKYVKNKIINKFEYRLYYDLYLDKVKTPYSLGVAFINHNGLSVCFFKNDEGIDPNYCVELLGLKNEYVHDASLELFKQWFIEFYCKENQIPLVPIT